MASSDTRRSILLVGAGGIGHPCLWALASSGVRELTVLDDDVVEETNLHRQILFEPSDVGSPKCVALSRVVAAKFPHLSLRTIEGRLLPNNAASLVASSSVVIDATDNFASRFLAADAAFLAGVPVVHGASVRWIGTVFASYRGSPCYRCLFEDLPAGEAPDCAGAGVVGPVCGVVGALAAELALRVVSGRAVGGEILTYDGATDRLRSVAVRARTDCALCGQPRTIRDLDAKRYEGAACRA